MERIRVTKEATKMILIVVVSRRHKGNGLFDPMDRGKIGNEPLKVICYLAD
jgi:hypothetical protein